MLRVAFTKAEKGNLYDKMVAWFCRGKYSHCELLFSDGIAFSSSPIEGGTRFASLDLSSDRFDILEIPCTKEQENQVRQWCRGEVDKNYDWFAIFGYVINSLIGWLFFCKSLLHDKSHWYCSEICMMALWKFGIVDIEYEQIQIHPCEMYNLLSDKLQKTEEI